MTKKIVFMTVMLFAVLAFLNVIGVVRAQETELNLGEAVNNAQNGTLVLNEGATYNVTSTVNITKNITIDLNGATVTGNITSPIVTVNHGVKVTFKDSKGGGTIENKGKNDALFVKGEAVLEGGTYKAETSDNTFGAIQVGSSDSTAGILTVESGVTISGIYGVSVSGTASILDVKGGTIKATGFAISGNASNAKNSTIKISGGTMTGAVGIYHPQSGSLTITGGKITGNDGFGVVVRNGTVDVKGGTITGTGTDSISLGVEEPAFQGGSAILVDNKTSGYDDKTGNGSGKAVVNISGGILNSNDENHDAVVSYNGEGDNNGGNADDFNITGGAYSAKFNQAFIKNNAAEVSIADGGKTTYYVGKTAVEAVNNAEVGSHVTVEKGTLEIANLPSGVTFEGAVTVTNPSSSGDTVETIKSNLQALIAKAEGEENASAELTNAINTARAVLANAGATYGDLQKALANLQSAYDNFNGGNVNENQGIVSGNESNEAGDNDKLDDEPKMGENYVVFGAIALCVVLAVIVNSKKRARR